MALLHGPDEDPRRTVLPSCSAGNLAVVHSRVLGRLHGISSVIIVRGTGRGGIGGMGEGARGGETTGGGGGGGGGDAGSGSGSGAGGGRGLGGAPRPINSMERARQILCSTCEPSFEILGLSCTYSFCKRGTAPPQRSASSRKRAASSPKSLSPI